MLKKNGPIPLYSQLIDELINEIETKYEPDTKIMSEREICKRYDVSRTTVRLALLELENMGYIYKQHGKGTFVSKKKENKKNLVENYSFTETMRALNKVPKTIVVSFERIPVNRHIVEYTGLTYKDEVYRLERIRLADEEPMMYEISYLPVSIFPNLTLEQLESRPLYEIFQQNYNQKVYYADEEFSASTVTDREAEKLQLSAGSSCLRIHRLAYNQKEQVIEYTISAARSDQFVYKVRIIK